MQHDLKCLHLSNYWNLFHYLIYLKKHVLIFCLKWLQVLLLGEGIAENRARIVEGRGLFPPILIYLECQRNTLTEQIIGQAMLFFICSRKKKKRLLGLLRVSHNSRPTKSSCNPSPFGSFQHTVASSFLYSLFVTTLICGGLGIFCWLICK